MGNGPIDRRRAPDIFFVRRSSSYGKRNDGLLHLSNWRNGGSGVESTGRTGAPSTARLIKEVDAPRDMVMQAIGWLAREDKIDIEDGRARIISLR